MKYLKQFGIIIVISLMGELLYELLPFSIPASIYGLVIMLIALMTGILKVNQVKEASSFFLEMMPILFIPPTVGLITTWGTLQEILVPVLIVCIIGTMLVMGVTGKITELIINKTGNNKGGHNQ